ncbi:MAG: ABC transporter substrate-binding protein [Deltaproteobacteria bacterium]|nr:ABC transporter substrate-binding protein [Deltaproteobacteria bacterium]
MAALVLFVLALSACGGRKSSERAHVVVFKHGRIEGDPSRFQRLLRRFEALHPGLRVVDEALPSSTDEQHQFYVINLEAGSADFDVLSLDVIWVPEFARAGWLLEVTPLASENDRRDFFPAAAEAVSFQGRLYALPWYADAGLLFYRKDLLAKYGLAPPRRWEELVQTALRVTRDEPGLYGFVWQGKQGEGLVCNVLEFLWGNGGGVLASGRPVLSTPPNLEALAFVRSLIVPYRVSPELVTTADEETTRHIFGEGRALFMRNWPYAYDVLSREGSRVRGKVGVAPLPAFGSGASASTLGGWQLGINRRSRNVDGAQRLVRYLASREAQKELALSVGYRPSRRSLYRDPDVLGRLPFTRTMEEVLAKARPRPVTPYYMMITQILQPELSAAVAGIRTPARALGSADRQIAHLLELER